MSERELLEAAARAVGIAVEWDAGSKQPVMIDAEGLRCGWWNPLADDGDALRLAVKLRITDLALAVGQYVCTTTHREGDDIYAITRRAITRAAAEIGRAEDGREP